MWFASHMWHGNMSRRTLITFSVQLYNQKILMKGYFVLQTLYYPTHAQMYNS